MRLLTIILIPLVFSAGCKKTFEDIFGKPKKIEVILQCVYQSKDAISKLCETKTGLAWSPFNIEDKKAIQSILESIELDQHPEIKTPCYSCHCIPVIRVIFYDDRGEEIEWLRNLDRVDSGRVELGTTLDKKKHSCKIYKVTNPKAVYNALRKYVPLNEWRGDFR